MPFRVLLAAALCLPTLGFADAPVAGTRAAPPAATASSGNTAELGQVDVNSIKPLVEVLEQMKTAIDAPYDNSPKHYDDMVCRLRENAGFRAQGLILDCGSQGWYAMQRNIRNRDMNVVEDTSLSTTPTLGHPWHIVRLLNHEQLAALRKVLGKLPEPGKGDVQVILDDGTPAAASQAAPAAATQAGGKA